MTSFWSFDWSWWKLAAGALFLLAAVWLSAGNARRERNGRRVGWLEAVRLLAVAMIAVTLLRPERVRTIRHTGRPVVAVLADASGSMATEDVVTGGVTRAVSRADWLAGRREARFWEPLEERYDVTVRDVAAAPTNAAPDADPGTDLNAALDEAARQSSNLRAVVLLSDGDWNQGVSPVAAATRLRLRGVPVYAATVGSDRHLPDLELVSVAAPAYALLDEHVTLPFVVQSRLPREVRATATLSGPDGTAVKKDLVIPALGQLDAAMTLVPAREGEATYTLRLPVLPEEARGDNNAREFKIAFRREKLKVLIVESTPRWEYRYLRNACVRDPGVDIDCLLLHPGLAAGGGRGYLSAFPATREALSQFDVVFLGDVGIGADQLSEENARQLRGLVEQQASGLVFLPGFAGREASLVASPLGELMPVTLDDKTPAGFGQTLESRLTLTQRGRDHLLTMLAANPADNEAVWRGLPGFQWYAPVLRAKPGTDVLAVHADARNEHGRIPLLVTRAAGNGKVLFMGTDSAWRWRRGVEDVYHYRFWGQVVRWMAHQRHLAHAEGIRFFFTPEAPARGDRVFLHATVFDAAGAPLAAGAVEASLKSASGAAETVELAPEEGGWGIFTGSFVPREGGSWSASVHCRENGRRVETAIPVTTPRTERVGRPARAAVLRELASITGGRAGGADELDALVAEVRALPEPQPAEERFRLWCHPAWAGAIVFLLAAYWTGRKWLGKI